MIGIAGYPPGFVTFPSGDLQRYTDFFASTLFMQIPQGTKVVPVKGTLVARNKNKAVGEMMERTPQAEWFWSMGDDHTWPPDLIPRLLDRNVDVVAPVALKRKPPFGPVIYKAKNENGTFRRYELSELPKEGGLLEVVNCVGAFTRVETESGPRRIQEIVANRLPLKVRAFNTQTGSLEWAQITNWIKRPGTTEWVRLSYPGRSGALLATPDHKLWTRSGMRRAEEFAVGDEVFVASPTLSDDQEQLILGSLLGDAHLSVVYNERSGRRRQDSPLPSLQEAHSVKQRGYLEWKARALGNLRPRLEDVGGRFPSVRYRTPRAACLFPYIALCAPHGKKRVSRDWLDRIGPLALAVWFMDDGHLATVGKGRRPRLGWTCPPWTADEIEMCSRWFVERWGVKEPYAKELPPSRLGRRAWGLAFSADSSAELVRVISPYVEIQDKQYPWKRWVAADIERGDAEGVVPLPVLRVERVGPRRSKTAYDITVEPTHTFLANRVVSSNCSTAGMLIRRRVLEATAVHYNNMPIWFRTGQVAPDGMGEDLDWVSRARAAGFKVYVDLDITFRSHPHRRSIGHLSPMTVYLAQREDGTYYVELDLDHGVGVGLSEMVPAVDA